MGIFDSHSHYFESDFGEELFPLLDSLPEKGVEYILAIGDSIEASRFEISLAGITYPRKRARFPRAGLRT